MGETRVALITGGGGGIGAATAERIADSGVSVVIAGRSLSKCQVVARRLEERGGRAVALEFDVTDRIAIERTLQEAAELAGPIDWLVTSAGMVESAPLRTLAEQEELCRRHLDVNFHGARRVMEALLPGMIERGQGRVVHIASSAALHGYPFVAAYCASKHALLGYARAAALELAPRRIAVHVVCPWYVDSPMTDQSAARVAEKTGRGTEETRALFAAQNPGGRLIDPSEVADAILELLASDRAGVVVELDGRGTHTIDAGAPLPFS